MTIRTVLILAVLCLNARGGDWEALQYLVGEWIGEGSGQPGKGSGAFSFALDLQGRILVRRNWAEYPATKERPQFRHDDLMIVYRQSSDERVRAVYFDNEGHVIRYGVECSADGSRIVFVSDVEASAPRFRFTYTRVDAGKLKLKFEMAPPGKAEQFSTYIEGTARRK